MRLNVVNWSWTKRIEKYAQFGRKCDGNNLCGPGWKFSSNADQFSNQWSRGRVSSDLGLILPQKIVARCTCKLLLRPGNKGKRVPQLFLQPPPLNSLHVPPERERLSESLHLFVYLLAIPTFIRFATIRFDSTRFEVTSPTSKQWEKLMHAARMRINGRIR